MSDALGINPKKQYDSRHVHRDCSEWSLRIVKSSPPKNVTSKQSIEFLSLFLCISTHLGAVSDAFRVVASMPHVNSENFSPLIEIITYFCLAASAFAVSARFVTKYFVIHVISLDDYFVVLSLVCSRTHRVI